VNISSISGLFQKDRVKQTIRVEGQVVPDSRRCVQCGICSYHCPAGIDIRQHAWKNKAVNESMCLTCGECVDRCPRGALRFLKSDIF
jgi:Pyruvate/2-oxoacid:ferredoxin oxidoreductase delta subunit